MFDVQIFFRVQFHKQKRGEERENTNRAAQFRLLVLLRINYVKSSWFQFISSPGVKTLSNNQSFFRLHSILATDYIEEKTR